MSVEDDIRAWEEQQKRDALYNLLSPTFIVLGPLQSIYQSILDSIKPIERRKSLLEDPRTEQEREADPAWQQALRDQKQQRITAGFLAIATTAAGAYYFRKNQWLFWALIFCTVSGAYALAVKKDQAEGFTKPITF